MTEPQRDMAEFIAEANRIFDQHRLRPTELLISREYLAFWRAYAEIRFDLFNIRRRIKARRILREMGP